MQLDHYGKWCKPASIPSIYYYVCSRISLAIQECGKLIPCNEESHIYYACAITDPSIKLTDWSCFNNESHLNNQERLKLFEAWKYCILIWEEKSTQHVLLDLKFVDFFLPRQIEVSSMIQRDFLYFYFSNLTYHIFFRGKW